MSTLSAQTVWPELAAAMAEWQRKHDRFVSAAGMLRIAGRLGLDPLNPHAGREANTPGALIGTRLRLHVHEHEATRVRLLAAQAGVTMKELVTRELCDVLGTPYVAPIQAARRREPARNRNRPTTDAARKAAAKANAEMREAAAKTTSKGAPRRRVEPLRVEDMPCPVKQPSAAFLAWLAL